MSQLDTIQFRQLVDSAHLDGQEGDLSAASTSSLSSDQLAEKIRESCPKNFGALFHEMKWIKRGLIAELVLENQPLEPYFEIAASIQDCLRPHEASSATHSEAPNWSNIIRLAKKRCELHPKTYKHDIAMQRVLEARFFALADAAQRLKLKGYTCSVRNSVPDFPESERVRIVQEIEEQIRRLGAFSLIDNLFKFLKEQYSERMKRYFQPSGLSMTGPPKPSSLPFNFLLQLAVKQIRLPVTGPENAQEIWDNLRTLATDFAAIYDVEPYSHWELEFIDVHILIPYITDLALHDRFFGLRQYRSSDVEKVLRGLFDWVPDSTQEALGWTIIEAASVAEKLLSSAKPKGPTIFQKPELSSGFPAICPAKMAKIIDVFSHHQNPNNASVLPEEPGVVNFASKPLIPAENESLIMVDRAVCAPAFYEAIASELRPHDTQTQNHIGLAAERFLIKEMNARGVTVSSGKYSYPEGDGECDAVLETKDTIIFLELKGKPLTNAAQAGSDVKILLDLFKSLFNATFQTNQHEIMLRKKGALRLSSPTGTETEIELRERQVEKIAVTLLDFGRFQDRTVLTQILKTLLYATVTPRDPALADEFNKLNKKTAAIREQITQLASTDPQIGRKPFFNCWFLSIPQLLVLLDGVSSNDSFKTELWRTRHLSTHSLDWYFEMDYATKLHGNS